MKTMIKVLAKLGFISNMSSPVMCGVRLGRQKVAKIPVNSFRQIAGLPRHGPIIVRAIHDEPSRFDVLSVIKNGLLTRPELNAG
jgi:hypothetical protein